MHSSEIKGAYEAPEVIQLDFLAEDPILSSSTEDLFNGEPLN